MRKGLGKVNWQNCSGNISEQIRGNDVGHYAAENGRVKMPRRNEFLSALFFPHKNAVCLEKLKRG